MVAIAVAAVVYFWQNKSDDSLLPYGDVALKDAYQNGADADNLEPAKNDSQYEYTEKYSHLANRFSFSYPKGFMVISMPNDGVETIVVQNTATKVAAQITISPFKGDDMDITPDIIKVDIPDMKIDNPQEVPVGPSRKGLAFISDNPAFGSKSSEIWFVFKGNLYQISTYYRFDGFLKGLFATFKFF